MSPPGRPRLAHYALLAAVALAMFLPGFFTLPASDRDEARFAQASRQMVETGNFIDIRFQAQPRYKKPIGIYWLQAAAAMIAGGSAAPIWAYRLPSLVGAAAAVVLTAWAGAALFGPGTAILAALMLAGTLLLGIEARMAKTDAVLLATVVVAQGALARVYIGARGGQMPHAAVANAFWIALGLGILVKGPIILLVAAGTVLMLWALDRDAAWLRALKPLRGTGIALLIVLPWLVAITVASHGQFLGQAVGHDLLAKVAGGQESHGAPPGYYLLTVFLTFWPFAFLAAAAVPWAWAHRREPAVRLCIAWIVPAWIVFELVPTKLPHYVLPVFPALALLSAAAVAETAGGWGRWVRRAGLALHVVVGLALAGAVLGLALRFGGPSPLVVGIAVLAALAVAALPFSGARRPGRTGLLVGGLLAGTWVLTAATFAGVLPAVEAIWVSPRLAAALRAASPCPNSRFAVAGYAEPSIVFDAGTDITLGNGETAARHLLADPACAVAAVEQREDGAFHAALAAAARTPLPLATVEGLNYSRGGQRVRLTIYRLE